MTNRFYILFQDAIIRVTQKGIKNSIKRGYFGWTQEGEAKWTALDGRHYDNLDVDFGYFKQSQMPKGIETDGEAIYSVSENVHLFELNEGFNEAELMPTLEAWRKLF